MIDQILALLRTRAALIIDESAQPSAAYGFQRFDAANAQAGISGSVVSSQGGRHLEYSLNDNGRVSTSSEDVQDPVVTGHRCMASFATMKLRHRTADFHGETSFCSRPSRTDRQSIGRAYACAALARALTAVSPSHHFIRPRTPVDHSGLPPQNRTA